MFHCLYSSGFQPWVILSPIGAPPPQCLAMFRDIFACHNGAGTDMLLV